MIIPIRAWEYQLGAEIIRSHLRSRQAKLNRIFGVQTVDDVICGTTWRLFECIGRKLGGEKLPR